MYFLEVPQLKKVFSRTAILTLFIFISEALYSQYYVEGIVVDENSRGIEFASVIVQKDSILINGVFTDSLGYYKLLVENPGSYSMVCRSHEFQEKTVKTYLERDTIINIKLAYLVNEISQVTVTAKAPIIIKKVDRLIFNPSAMLSNVGRSAYDLLKVSPSVFADESGNISINGIVGTGVMIDGRLLQMSGEQVKDYLKSISSDEVYRIEIISNPSSKYDAEGISGLVNIILKKNQKRGIFGTGSLSYEQTRYAKYAGYFNVNYRTEKLILYGGTTFRIGEYQLIENVENIYNRDVEPYYYYEEGVRKRKETSSFSRIGLDYNLSKRSKVGFRLEYNHNNRYSIFQYDNLYVDSVYNSVNETQNVNNSITGNLSYLFNFDSLGQTLSVDIDYMSYYQPLYSLENSTQRIINSQPTNFLFKNTSSQKIEIASIRLDYSKPLKNNKTWLDFGGKFYSLYSKNQLSFFENEFSSWIQNHSKSSDFGYYEKNLALYSIIHHEFSNKLTAQLGIRNEFTWLNGTKNQDSSLFSRTYNRLFPSMFIHYEESKNHQFSLNYTNRISRPDYSNLNPFRYYLTPNNYIEGDPFLQPAFTNSLDFSYLFKQQAYLSVYANITNGQITQVPILDHLSNSYKTLSINVDRSYSYGFSIYMSKQIFKWWQSSINVRTGLNGIKTSLENQVYERQNFNVFCMSNNQFNISSKGGISAELNVIYQPQGYTQGIFTLGRLLEVSTSVKKVFKDNKFSVVLSFADLFNSAYVTALVDEGDQFSFINGNYDKRGIQITFLYNFGKSTIEKRVDKESSIKNETERL